MISQNLSKSENTKILLTQEKSQSIKNMFLKNKINYFEKESLDNCSSIYKDYANSTYNTELFDIVKNIIKNSSFLSKLNYTKVLKKILETCKKLLLNNIELIYFSILLERINSYDNNLPIDKKILLAGIWGKEEITSDKSALELLYFNIPDLKNSISSYKNKLVRYNSNLLTISFSDYSIEYNNLTSISTLTLLEKDSVEKGLNYNNMVTQLFDEFERDDQRINKMLGSFRKKNCKAKTQINSELIITQVNIINEQTNQQESSVYSSDDYSVKL